MNDVGDAPIVVLHLLHRWEPGGIARHLRDLTRGMAARGVTSLIAAEGIYDTPPRDADPIPLLLYSSTGRKTASGALRAISHLRRIISARGVTLVHAHSRYAALLAAMLGPVPRIYTSHSVFCERSLPPYPRVVICPTDPGARSFRVARPGHDVRIIPHGIDALPLPHRSAEEVCVFLVASRLDAGKGLETVVDAFALAQARRDFSAQLDIAGEGPLRPALEARVHARCLSGSVRFLGHVQDTRGLFPRARAVLMASTGLEGFGYTVLDAFAASVPVIASDLNVFDDRVRDGDTGLRFRAGDAAALCERLIHACGSPQEMEEMGARARALLVQEYSPGEMIDRTLAAYALALKAVPRGWAGSCRDKCPRSG
jgi:glycosyltransferase involved in cell wall biosynthesis